MFGISVINNTSSSSNDIYCDNIVANDNDSDDDSTDARDQTNYFVPKNFSSAFDRFVINKEHIFSS